MGKFLAYVAGICGIFLFHLLWYVKSISVAGVMSPRPWRLVTTAYMPLFMMLACGAAIVTRIAILAMRNERKTIDPKQWLLDRETGEYSKITSRRGNEYTFDKTNYSYRLGAWIAEADKREKSALNYAVVAVLILIGGKWLELGTNTFSSPPFIIYALASLVLCAGAWHWGLAERGRWDSVGPSPIQIPEPYYPDTDTRQSARQPDIGDIERALLARKGGQEPKFEA